MLTLQHVAVTFPPGGEATVRAFYGEGLGLTEMRVPDEVAHLGWVWFATAHEGVELHFIPHPIAPDPERIHHFCLQVDDLEALRVRLESMGAVVSDAGSRILGRTRAFVRDGIGNLVELVQLESAGGAQGTA